MAFDPKIIEGKKDSIVREKRILTSLILDRQFCQNYIEGLAGVYLAPELFSQPFARTISIWCFEYYKEFGYAIRNEIATFFEGNADSIDSGQLKMIGEFLDHLSNEFEIESDEYDEDASFMHRLVTDLVEQRSVELAQEKVSQAIKAGDHQRAASIMNQFAEGKLFSYSMDNASGITNLMDDEVFKRNSKSTSNNVLFQLEGPLGEFLGPFRRKSIVSFMGVEKSGKSFMLNEIMTQIALQNNEIQEQIQVAAEESGAGIARRPIKVLTIHIELDDYSSTMRFHQGLLKEAMENINNGHINLPYWDCANSQYGTCQNEKRTSYISLYELDLSSGKYIYNRENEKVYKPCTHCLECPQDAQFEAGKFYVPTAYNKFVAKNKISKKAALKKFQLLKMRMKNAQIYSKVLENFTATPERINNVIREFEMRHGSAPDVLLIDYLDIVSMRVGKKDTLEETDEKWRWAAQLAKNKNLCLITVEQSNRDGRSSLSLETVNTADSKTKDSHLSAKFGISATPYEDERNMFRVHSLLQRHKKQDVSKHLLCLKAVEIGQFIRDTELVTIDEWAASHAGLKQHLAYNNKRGFQTQKKDLKKY